MSKKIVVFSIVVYNELFWESITFNSLVSSFSKNKNNEEINIYIYDNSVRSKNINLPEFENDINIKYFAFNENRGISKAYNHLVSLALKDGFKWIVFLDQDTMLPLDFYYKYFDSVSEIKQSSHKMAVPVVKSGQHILSPFIYKNYRSRFLKESPSLINLNNHSAINTGILIDCNYFNKIGGYNEKLFLDFCDHDFFDKLRGFDNTISVINTELKQDFSTNTNTLDKALTRYRIFYCDLKAYKKGRNSFKLFFLVDLPHLIRLTLQYRTLKFIIYRLSKT